jgi:glycosyltransferase involved in cell wall biosynthesis
MQFHVVGLPHSHTTLAFSADAFGEKVRKFCNMMTDRGHHVTLYSGEFNEARVAEHVPIFTEQERVEALGNKHFSEASWNAQDPQWRRLNLRAANAIVERSQERGFVCLIGGVAMKPLADTLAQFAPSLTVVEFGIGYGGTFARYRVWESAAWMHTCIGAANPQAPQAARGNFFDDVIPGYFEPELFPFSSSKKDYVLFVGRMTELKGPHVADEAAKRAGRPLILAGPGTYDFGKHGKHIGEVGPDKRGDLMKNARALIMPTLYIEPFGNVAVEAQASGTPVITSPFGAMTETVLEGKTGYHCHTVGEFAWAMSDEALNRLWPPNQIRDRVVDEYSTAVIGEKYERYFLRLSEMWGDGWNTSKSFLLPGSAVYTPIERRDRSKGAGDAADTRATREDRGRSVQPRSGAKRKKRPA